MARSRYFCVAAKTTIETNKDDKIVSSPDTNVVLHVTMEVGIKSILYALWKEAQDNSGAENEVHIDAERNVFRLSQKQEDGMMRLVTWMALPCRGVKWNDTFEPVDDAEDNALDFVGDMYAEYNVARMKYIAKMLAEGASDEDIRLTGVTAEEIEKARQHNSQNPG